MAANNAEDFILRLQQQVSGPAAVADSALAQLESRILAEQAALGGLEGKLAAASAKLQKLGEGTDGRVSISAIRRQQEAVASLQAEIDRTRGSIGQLEGARGLAEQADQMKAAAAAAASAAAQLAAEQKAAAAAAAQLAAEQRAAAAAAREAQAAQEALGAAMARQVEAEQAAAAVAAANQAAVSRGIAERAAMADTAAAAALARAQATAQAEADAGAAADARAASELRIAESAYQAAEMERQLATALRAANDAASASALADAEAAADAAADALAESQLKIAESAYQAAEMERKLAEQLSATKGAASDAAKKQTALARATSSGNVNFGELGESLSKLGGPLGAAGADLGRLGAGFSKLGALGPAGIIAAITVAVVALGVALAAGVVSISRWAIGLADANRTAKLGKEDALSLAQQSKKFDENIKGTFGGLKIDGFLTALSRLVALFDSNTASGRAMKVVFETIFQPIIDKATELMPVVERVFLTLLIWSLKAYLAIKPYSAELKAVGLALLVVAAIVGGVLVASFAILAAVILLPIAAFLLLQIAAQKVGEFLKGLDWGSVGTDLVIGLVIGILGGIPNAISAAAQLGSAMVAAAKGALKQNSPSRVFHEIGLGTAAGMAEGVDEGAPEAVEATRGMARGAAQAGADGMKGGGASVESKGGGERPIIFDRCIFGDNSEVGLRAAVRKILHEEALTAEPAT